jgi:myo-inositol-1(or 4)-monophosphatase
MAESLDVVRDLLREAGTLAMRTFGHVAAEEKADHSLVSEADRAVEALIVRALHRAFPADGVVGEEGTRIDGGPACWFVDPIDGTASFLEGLAYWGPTFARVVDGVPCIGGMYLPRLDELYDFERAGGARLNGRRLPDLMDSSLRREGVLLVPSQYHRLATLEYPGKARSLGSTSAHLCRVAAGSAVAAWVSRPWQNWDVVAGLGMVLEVGGVARAVEGHDVVPLGEDTTSFFAGDRRTVARLLPPDGWVCWKRDKRQLPGDERRQ